MNRNSKKMHGGRNRSSSWENVSSWYNKITKNSGHYYHEHVVIPKVIKLLELNIKSQNSKVKILDIACGNGVLGRAMPKNVDYLGVDIAPSLIAEAKRSDHNHQHKYIVADATNPLIPQISPITPISPNSFSHATIILALQNIADPSAVFKNVSNCLMPNAYFVIVLNHPAFRIPRQSSWGIDEERKLQYRRIDKYMSPMEIPIRMNPGDPHSQQTMSYHYPLSYYVGILSDLGYVITNIEEWTSDKESIGRASKMENRSRNEIPLFMAIVAKKVE